MKKLTTLSLAVVGALLLLVAGPLRPAYGAVGTYFDQSVIVNVSSQTTSPTLLFAGINSAYADVRLICTQLNNTGEYIMLKSESTGFSTSVTTGTARFPCLPATVQQLDFWINDYRGPLYAVAIASYTIPINIWRKR